MRTKRNITPTTDATTTPPALSTKVSQLVTALRVPFFAFTEGLGHLTEARADLAPKFMKVFRLWRKETNGSFVGFVRWLDPKVPIARAEYKKNPSYNSADNLRRLERKPARVQVPKGKQPVTPFVALARLIATVMPVVDPSGSILSTFIDEMHWTPQQAERLRVLAAKEGAIRLAPRTKHTLLKRAA